MFNKKLLNSAIVAATAVMVGSQAMAANTLTGTATTHTTEGLNVATTYSTVASTLTLKQNYVQNDEVHITVSQPIGTTAAIAQGANKFPSTLSVDLSGNGKAVGGSDTVTLSRFFNDTTVGKYRFGAITDGGTDGTPTVDGTIAIPAMNTVTHNGVSTTITVHTQNSSGGTIDADVSLVTANHLGAQLSATVSKKFNGIIDVDKGLTQFTLGNDSVTTDVSTITTSSLSTALTTRASVNSVGVVVAGDFAFLDSLTTDTGMTLAATHGNLTLTGTMTGGTAGVCDASANTLYNTAMTTYTAACAVINADKDRASHVNTLTWNVVQATGNAMSPRDWTVTSNTSYDPATAVSPDLVAANVAAATSLGAWTKNTANMTAYSVPFSTSVTRMLWIANNSAAAAAVTASVEAAGVTYGPYDVGSVGAKSNLAIGQALDTKLAADAAWVAAAYTSRANVTVTAATSSSSIELSAGYYSTNDKDRQTLATSQTQ